MPERPTFARRLKALRAQAGLTQAALAERSGVAVSTIRQFEYGLREPTLGTLLKLADGLGVSLDVFAGRGEAPPAPPVAPSQKLGEKPPAGDAKPRGRPRKASGPRKRGGES